MIVSLEVSGEDFAVIVASLNRYSENRPRTGPNINRITSDLLLQADRFSSYKEIEEIHKAIRKAYYHDNPMMLECWS